MNLNLKQLREDVNTIMFTKYEEGLDCWDMCDIVVNELVNHFIYSNYIVLVYGKTIVKEIEKWLTNNH